MIRRSHSFCRKTPRETVDWAIGLCEQASLRALVETNRAIGATDFRAELTRIKIPVSIIHGDQDVSAPLDFTGRRAAALIPQSKLTVYEGAPHGLFITHRERLSRDLLALVKSS